MTANDFSLSDKFLKLSRRILRYANRGEPRIAFLKEISKQLMEFSGCDGFELRMQDGKLSFRWQITQRLNTEFSFKPLPPAKENSPSLCLPESTPLEILCKIICEHSFDPDAPGFTSSGSYWTNNTRNIPDFLIKEGDRPWDFIVSNGDRIYNSLMIIPFAIDTENSGLMMLKSEELNWFLPNEIEMYEGVAQTLGLALADRHAQAALRERVKELTCLYGIAKVIENNNIDHNEKLQQIVNLLPPSWQYPSIAVGRITVDEHDYLTPTYKQGPYQQQAPILVHGQKRGEVAVAYIEEDAELVEGPFLREEASLIGEVARQIATIVEKDEAELEKTRLEEQLRHADRLATLGKLAAGVAHEINEPLGSILGFAQLAKKSLNNPIQVERDLEKIVNASLQAREIVRQLLIFARQMPTKKKTVNLNSIVKDALSFLDPRCQKDGITQNLKLHEHLPFIEADPAQLSQLFINLVVNAIQAMPEGGSLTVSTAFNDDEVLLVVEDTGIGMDEETKKQIFNPFYTTKDADKGTGLGLSVVHGIITSHSGSIQVDSAPGKGSRFKVRLPRVNPSPQ